MSNLEAITTESIINIAVYTRKGIKRKYPQRSNQTPVDDSRITSVDLTSPLAQRHLVRSGSDPAAIQAFLRLSRP